MGFDPLTGTISEDWNERIPGMGGTPGMPNIQQLAQYLKLGGTQNAGPAPQSPIGPISPAMPGGPPPNVVNIPGLPQSTAGMGGGGLGQAPGGMGGGGSIQQMPRGGVGVTGGAPLSAAQQAGPAGRTALLRGYEGPYQFGHGKSTGAVVDNAIKGLQSAVIQYKQNKFNQEAAQGQVLALAQIANQKQQNGEPLTAQDIQAIKAAEQLQKKAPKILEKAMTDPMSGAYVGMQRGFDAYQQQELQKATIQGMQAEAALRASQAKKAEAEANFWQNWKGPLEQQKIDAKSATDYAKLYSHNLEKGIKTEMTPEGITQRKFTQEEIDADPQLKQKQAVEKAKVDRVAEIIRRDKANEAIAWAKLNQQKLLKNAELALREKLGSAKLDQLSNHDKGRMSQVYMAQGYLDEMQDIVKRRPELFGAGNWGIQKFKQAVSDQDQDAAKFVADAKLLSLPIVGIHDSRSAVMARDVQDFSDNMFQSQETAAARLAEIQQGIDRAEGDIMKPYSIRFGKGGTTTATTTDKKDDKKTGTGDRPDGW